MIYSDVMEEHTGDAITRITPHSTTFFSAFSFYAFFRKN
jgi:hypothetical protein